MVENPLDITALLEASVSGKEEAHSKLFSIVYKELHPFARALLQKEHPGHLMQTTMLIDDIYIRLVHKGEQKWQNRAHFFCAAAKAMRQILAGEARKRKAAKRGYGKSPVSLDKLKEPDHQSSSHPFSFDDLEALDINLTKLESNITFKLGCEIINLHFFTAMPFEKIAETLRLSKSTVIREWDFVRTWLHKEIHK